MFLLTGPYSREIGLKTIDIQPQLPVPNMKPIYFLPTIGQLVAVCLCDSMFWPAVVECIQGRGANLQYLLRLADQRSSRHLVAP